MTTTTPNEPTNNEVAVNDIDSTEELLAAVDETIKYFDDGDIVEGTVVKVTATRSSSTSATRLRALSSLASCPLSMT